MTFVTTATPSRVSTSCEHLGEVERGDWVSTAQLRDAICQFPSAVLHQSGLAQVALPLLSLLQDQHWQSPHTSGSKDDRHVMSKAPDT